jgi:predicted flap endonuclease-1-like 5' DNA nuclease
MPTFTTQQWVILFLVFVLGWLLGLLSRSSKKWRRAYEAERDARVEEQREHGAALEASQARVAELERERPIAATAAAAPVVASATTTPSNLDLRRDDLSLIRGLGPEGEADLNEEGIYRYSQIAEMTQAEEIELEDRLGADRGYIRQEQWREQARLLADGHLEEHRATFR